jgi:uncharacterized membrane protein YsdA (DUF1294 family)
MFALLGVLPLLGILELAKDYGRAYVWSYAVTVSMITAFFYWKDKKSSKSGGWRVSERTLHILELAGGWAVAFWMQRAIRHKIRKISYQVVYWVIIVFHQFIALDYLQSWRLAEAGLKQVQEYLK